METMTALHEPVNAGPFDADDYRVCGTCGTDLYSLVACPDAPVAECGCPLYVTNTGDHLGGCVDE
jgi:hypothetical protein